MANSIVIANVEIQLQDALQSSIPPVLFRTVPPIAYPSTFQTAYNGYSLLNAGDTQTLVSAFEVPFAYVRNAGARGVLIVQATGLQTPDAFTSLNLTPGGVFLFANSSFNTGYKNVLTNLTITCFGQAPAIAEWLIAQ